MYTLNTSRPIKLGGTFKQLNMHINPHQTGVSEYLIKWPTRGNQLYRLYFCILSNKNHIKGV